MSLQQLRDKIINGYLITKKDALTLVTAPLETLVKCANEIREYFCGRNFELCSIFNGKCGSCTEDCKFCVQSAKYNTGVTIIPLVTDKDVLIKDACFNEQKGIKRFSIVTSGRGLNADETKEVCENYKAIKNGCNILLCASHGILTYDQLLMLKNAGVTRIHCNIETSRNFFTNVCTTHTYDQRTETIKSAKKAGLEVCSGGIFGLGETWNDRIDMAFDLRELGTVSVPINILRPIKGTPLENNKPISAEEVQRIVAIFRFILPSTSIRMGAGRGLMDDKGQAVFLAGANACISGDMLTTSGVHVDEDVPMLRKLGFEIK
jgi:biotin synthase